MEETIVSDGTHTGSPERRTMREQLLKAIPASLTEAMLRVNRRFGSGTNVRFYHELHRIRRELGDTDSVMQGPFMGTRIMPQLRGNWLKCVLGTYEKEVWPAVEALCEYEPEVVVNVGAAAGYYSVGLARRLPETTVVAFEGQRLWRSMHARNERANGVDDRVALRGFCTPRELEDVIATQARPALIVDIDGGEDSLLDPAALPALTRSVIMVEVHDHIATGVSGRLRERFEGTHEIEKFLIERRAPSDLPENCELSSEDALFAMDERRGTYPQPIWLMRPHG
jgi:hypothetical protein